MKILFAASEALPFAATGGLGDVMGSLPAALKRKYGDGYDVRGVIPLYPSVRERFGDTLRFVGTCDVRLAWRQLYCGIFECERDGVHWYFIDNEYYFKRESMYGSFDDGERFAYFGMAVMELMRRVNFFPDILHANDWQSATAVIYLRLKYSGFGEYAQVRSVFTIHNIEYQGVYGREILGDVFGLGEWDLPSVSCMGDINLLKGAVTLADAVTTVSERYASEIQTQYYSHGLHYILSAESYKLRGIVNGIDTAYYNPETDTTIAANYSADDMSGKAECRRELQRISGFDIESNTPIVAMVTRLAAHKGIDLVCHVIEEILTSDDVNFVILGTGEREYEQYFITLSERYGGKFHAFLGFDKELSKKLYAGADMFLMPSKSEPCGLAQMIASRYGTPAIVRECGGLYDTITPYNVFDGSGNGFSFANYNAHEMMGTLRFALGMYRDMDAWHNIIHAAMTTDFSWEKSAEKYAALYDETSFGG